MIYFTHTSQVSEIVNRPRSTIQGVIDRYRDRKTLKNKSRSGCTRKNEYTGQQIICQIKRNTTKNSNTVHNFLRKSGYYVQYNL